MNVAVKPDYMGHRQRMLQKLNQNGYEQFADYEIVEIMLFLIFKRKDTKPLAKKLLRKFKNLDGILNADTRSLLELEGIGLAVCNSIKIINMLIKASLRSQLYSFPVLNCLCDVINYAKNHMVNLFYEEARILCLNSKNYVIDDQVIQRGSVNSVALYPREIIRLCLQSNTTRFILIHNHPSGDPTPSLNDQYITNKLVEICNALEIKLVDHIIVSKDQCVSFKALGLLDPPPLNNRF